MTGPQLPNLPTDILSQQSLKQTPSKQEVKVLQIFGVS
jgi:hypothetical protein